jgi:D-cysteine desulfhydrase
LIDGYYGTGYAKTNRAVATHSPNGGVGGLILDPVYTGKAFYGLAQERMKGRIPAGSKVFFSHTGVFMACRHYTG